jgi:hypothetical protein
MTVTDDEEEEASAGKTKDLLPAKTASKAAQVFAAAWVITLTILKGFGIIRLEVDEIIYTAIAIVGIYRAWRFGIFHTICFFRLSFRLWQGEESGTAGMGRSGSAENERRDFLSKGKSEHHAGGIW